MHTQIHPKTLKPQSFITISTLPTSSKLDITFEECKENLKHIHTTITSQYLSSKKNNKLTNTTLWHSFIRTNILSYAYKTGTTQSQQTPLLQSYLHTVNPETYMPQCPVFLSHTHGTNYLLNCSQVPTQHNTTN